MKKLYSIFTVSLICIFCSAAYLQQPQVVEFSSFSALPQDANNINLECKYYHWLGTEQTVITKSIVFPAGCDSGLIGQSILDAPIVYGNVGTFLKTPSADDLNGAVIDNGDGTVRLTTTTEHPFVAGNVILISDTTNYNGYYAVVATPTANTFDITETYVSETLTNAIAKAGTKSIRLQNIAFAAPAGTMFDIEGLDRINTFIRPHDVIFNNVANLGYINNISFLTGTVNFADFGQGIVANNARFTVENNISFSSPKTATKNQDCTFDNVGNTVDATAHYMYDGDLVRLTTDNTLPSGLYGDVSLSSVADNGSGQPRFTTGANHNLNIGDTIFIFSTTNYEGFREVLATPSATTFDVDMDYTAETFSSSKVQHVYFIINKTDNDFQLSKTEGGSVVTFTDNGTGNHEFFENTIGLTMRGSVYSFTLEKPVFAGSPETFTYWKFEPTISGTLGRGSIIGAGYDLLNKYNHFTNGGLNQTYVQFNVSDTKNGDDSKVSGVLYITGNTADTTLTGSPTIDEVTEGTEDIYNNERTELSNGRICNTDPSSRFAKVNVVMSLVRGDANVKTIRPHILKNGTEDVSSSEPVVDVANSNISVSDFEEVEWELGDCLSLGLESENGATDVQVSEYKLGVSN